MYIAVCFLVFTEEIIFSILEVTTKTNDKINRPITDTLTTFPLPPFQQSHELTKALGQELTYYKFIKIQIEDARFKHIFIFKATRAPFQRVDLPFVLLFRLSLCVRFVILCFLFVSF